MIHPKQHYLDVFRIGESQLDTLVAESLRHGGDYADLFFENTTRAALFIPNDCNAPTTVSTRAVPIPRFLKPGLTAV